MKHDGGPVTDVGAPFILVVDGDRILCNTLSLALGRLGLRPAVAHSADAAVRQALEQRPAYAIVELRLPDQSGLKLLPRLLEIHPAMRVAMLTGHGSIATAVAAIKLGAVHYLTKPMAADDLLAALSQDFCGDDVPVSDRPMSTRRLEWEHINRVLLDHRGNISATARALLLHRRTLQRKLARHVVSS
ncbi:MAG: response regulator [Betaproteobacteria bacterium]